MAASLSVTVRVALNVPKVRYVWATETPLAPVESSKFQAYETIFPSGSEEPEASNATGELTIAGFGVAVNEAIGGWPESQYREDGEGAGSPKRTHGPRAT